MTARAEVLGVHPLDERPKPCFLVALRIEGARGIDVGSITQEAADLPQDEWQVPWDERALTRDGELLEAGPLRPIDGDAHVVFFFHHLDTDRPLLTPAGGVPLPAPTPRPPRLAAIAYEEP